MTPINLDDIDKDTIEIDGIDHMDYPNFTDAYISKASFCSGVELTEEELDELNDYFGDFRYQKVFEWAVG